MTFYNLEDALKSPDQVTTLVLYRRSLSTWPDALFRFKHLEHLEFDQCGITHLDERLTQLPLVSLKLPRNEISMIPAWFGKLTRLHTLDISNNALATFQSDQIPPVLIHVHLRNNRLHHLPTELLYQARTLDIGRNPLSRMKWPNRLDQLRALHLDRSPAAADRFLSCSAPVLTHLNIIYSKVTAFSENWWSRFPSLTHVNLTGNSLTHFPDPRPAHDLPLEYLNLAKNQLVELPDSWNAAPRLRDLDLSGNDLQNLPDSFRNLGRLTRVNLAGNPIRSVPVSWASLTYLKSLDIRKTKIDDLATGPWPGLETLFIHNSPLAQRTDILRSLPVRIRVTGKGASKTRLPLSLASFRKKAVEANWSESYQDRIWQLAQFNSSSHHDRSSVAELLDLWTLGLPGMQEQLIRRAPGKRIRKGDQLLVFGRTWLPANALQKRVEQAGLSIVTNTSNAANLVLLGGPQGDPRILNAGRQSWWTEPMLLAHLPPLKPPHPAAEDHAEKVISLLGSRISTYHMMAVQALHDQGIPTVLYGELLWIIRNELISALRRKWPELVMLYGQADWVVDCLKPKKDLREDIESLARKWGCTTEVLANWSR